MTNVCYLLLLAIPTFVCQSTTPLDNITSSTTVSTESTWTDTTPNPVTEPTAEPHSAMTQQHLDYDLFCTCDLISGQCDVNCCCDTDCGPDERRLFDHCWQPPSSHFQRHYCSPDHGVAWNNTPQFRTRWNPHSGMFCIVTDNVPKRRMYEEKPPISDQELFQHILPKVSGRWNDRKVLPPVLDKWIHQPFYKQGSPIYTLHINGSISALKLPGSLNSARCNIGKTVRFLQDETHRCSLGPCNATAIRVDRWLANLAVFRLPSHSANGNSSRWGDLDKLAPIVVRICETKSECRTDVAEAPSCGHSLQTVTLRVGFNGTEGIRFVVADLHYTETTTSGSVQFQVTYHSLAGGNQPVRMKSGNPGYLNGKPLVTAKLNSSSGEAAAFKSLQLFPRTTQSRIIRFGQDSHQTVKMADVVFVDPTVEWCSSSNWSKFILECFWGPEFGQLRLGVFGNVELNETSWLPIEIHQSELQCLGSVVHADLVIVYTTSGTYDQPQNKLLGAGLQLRSGENGPYCMESSTCSLQLSQTVSFVVKDSPTYLLLPQPPRWKIQLPRDFFYPFLLSGSCRLVSLSLATYLFIFFAIVSILF